MNPASGFAAVDDGADPSRLLAYLDCAAASLTAMKHYVAAAAARAVPGGTVADIGCGAGHDLLLLAAQGLLPVGVEPSATMLAEAARRLRAAGRLARLVRADGARLPFRSGSLDGCRIERVLQHTAAPGRVLDEAARVLRSGGFLAVFEPDWTSLTFRGDDPHAAAVLPSLMHVSQPGVGREVHDMVAEHGVQVLDRVTESSHVEALDALPFDVGALLAEATARGTLMASTAEDWRARQTERERRGEFHASWDKVLVIARKR